MNNRTVPTATVVEESSNSEDLPVAPSVRLIGRTLVSSMDRSLDNRTENGAPAVTGGVDGTALTAQRELGDGLLALLTDAFGSDTRGKTRQTVKSFISRFIDEIDDSNMTRALELLACASSTSVTSVKEREIWHSGQCVNLRRTTKTFSFSTSTFCERVR